MAQSRGPTILIAMWTTTSIATFFVAARVYTRLKILRSFGLDDYLMVFSIILGLLFVGLTTAAVEAGDGQYANALTQSGFERAALLNTAGFAPGILAFVLPKLGVVALLCRIFNPSRRWKLSLWTFVGASGLVICGCIVIIYAQCRPTKALWTPGLGKCWNPVVLVDYSIFAGALSAFLDIFLASYPVPILWKLQLPMRKRIILSVAFALGACAAIVAIIKCTHIPGLADESDSTYSTSELVIWTNAESNATIIASCIPTCIPLVEILFFGRSMNNYQGGQEVLAPESRSVSFLDRRFKSRAHNHFSLREIRRTDEVSLWYEDR